MAAEIAVCGSINLWSLIICCLVLQCVSRIFISRPWNLKNAYSSNKAVNGIRHRENLLRAENSRIGRIYHSQQIEKNGKVSCFHNKITKKVPSAQKMIENVTENFDIQKYYMKNELKKIQNDS